MISSFLSNILFVLLLSSMSGVGHAQTINSIKDQIQYLYSSYASLGMVAESTDAEREIIVAVISDGQFSFVQYDKQMFSNMYSSTSRDIDKEWEVVPAHFNYYDGMLRMISSAPFDSARMFIERKIEDPMPLGSAIQSQHCIWPVLPALLDQGELSTGDDQIVLHVKHLELHVYMNSSYQITKVNLGESQSPLAPRVSFGYSGFENSGDPLLPSTMTRAFGHVQSGLKDSELVHERYSLQFVRDQDQVAKMVAFTNDSGKLVRKDAATDNVYDVDGALLYNEKEMADEYLAAIKDSGPGQWRTILLIGVGCLAIGSAVVLKMKRAA